MDFTFSQDQTAVRDLARRILEREVTTDRLKRAEADGEWFDRRLWSALAEAGLLGLSVPAELGGMGLGLPELCVLLEEVGRVVAPIPLLETLVLGALPIAAFGTDAQRRRWLGAVAGGEAILTAALVDAGPGELSEPATLARRARDGFTLEGEKPLVPAAHLAARVLVPATAEDGVAVFLLDPKAPGVALERRHTSRGEPLCTLRLDAARVAADDLLGGKSGTGGTIVQWMHQRALAAIAALQLGVSERALALTVDYVRQREQFGVPIGSFQAVQHRCADSYIDVEALRWVTWRAVWKLAQGEPAAREAAVAKFWAADAGARVAASAQHLHAGIGVDLDYPIHRYFLWSKALELALGGATSQLARLGRDLARRPPEER